MPFNFYAGTIVGPGNQLMSWIHISDLVRAVRFLLEHENSSGPYNLTTLKPASIRDFINTIGKITGRPVWMKVPGWALKIIFGHMAEETILASQNIYPARLLKEGFSFEYTEHEKALKNLLEK
jgi:hypothetical protein